MVHKISTSAEQVKKNYTYNRQHPDFANNRAGITKKHREKKKAQKVAFPPEPSSDALKETIIKGWCADMSPDNFVESGCAVCGQLTPLRELKKLSNTDCDLDILIREGIGLTRLERLSKYDPILEVKGPILDETCSKICIHCEGSLSQGLMPKYALANGLWLGSIPSQLKDLYYAEQLLISWVRRSKCIVRVSLGMHKMKANAIMFENPTPKIYSRLPPSLDDLDDVLAFIWTGPIKPTPEDMERTPMLVRRKKVTEALEWLQLNHLDYYDLDIAYDILEKYPERGPPVVMAYRHAESNKDPQAVSAFDNELEEGTEEGKCPFVVNGVTREELNLMMPDEMKVRAMKHLKEEHGGVLAIGHNDKPLSMFHNPRLYPMMFPWLFPYGLGGVDAIKSDDIVMSAMMHKQKLLMYHDKRFQMDHHFPLVALNHEQIKKGTQGGYLLTEKHNFDTIADRLTNIDIVVLEDLSKRLSRGDRVKPETPEEKACYDLITDLDHVRGHVPGSITSKNIYVE